MLRISAAGIAVSLLFASAPVSAQDHASEDKPKQKVVTEKKSKKKKSDFSFKFNGAVGGGFDSNAYNRAEKNTVAGIGDVRVGTKLGFHIVPRLSWTGGADFGVPIRGGTQSAVKLKAGAKTGINWLVFGMKKIPGGKKVAKKKQAFPAGVITVTGKYAFSANPVINTFEAPPPEEGEEPIEGEEEIPIDVEEEYVGDPEVDEVLEDEDYGEEDEEDFDDGDDDEEDTGDEASEEELDEEEEDVDDFGDVDTLSESFGLANPKHNFGADLKFTFNPWKKTALGVSGVVDRNLVGVEEGKPSNNSTRYGTTIKLKQKIAMFGVGAQYGFDYRLFDEKAPKSDPGLYLTFLVHKPGAFVDVKLFKRWKLKLSYGYQSRLTGIEDPLDSFKHNVKLGSKLKLTSFMALLAQASYGFQGRLDTTDKDATRFQGVLGLQFKM
jgi:hypothetical protein